MNSIRIGRILSTIFWRSTGVAIVLGIALYAASVVALIIEAPRP